MPTPCYISITGQTQGNITAGAFTADSVGNIYVQGHEDEMLVQEFLHNVTVPTDPQSGQPAGQRAHKPFIFTVALNKAVPLMYNALASGEMLPTTELHWWRRGAEGPPGEPGAGCEGAAGRDGPCAARPVAVYSFPRLQQLPDQDARAGGGVRSRLESALRYPLTDTR